MFAFTIHKRIQEEKCLLGEWCSFVSFSDSYYGPDWNMKNMASREDETSLAGETQTNQVGRENIVDPRRQPFEI